MFEVGQFVKYNNEYRGSHCKKEYNHLTRIVFKIVSPCYVHDYRSVVEVVEHPAFALSSICRPPNGAPYKVKPIRYKKNELVGTRYTFDDSALVEHTPIPESERGKLILDKKFFNRVPDVWVTKNLITCGRVVLSPPLVANVGGVIKEENGKPVFDAEKIQEAAGGAAYVADQTGEEHNTEAYLWERIALHTKQKRLDASRFDFRKSGDRYGELHGWDRPLWLDKKLMAAWNMRPTDKHYFTVTDAPDGKNQPPAVHVWGPDGKCCGTVMPLDKPKK